MDSSTTQSVKKLFQNTKVEFNDPLDGFTFNLEITLAGGFNCLKCNG